jgi:hypothetical protein
MAAADSRWCRWRACCSPAARSGAIARGCARAAWRNADIDDCSCRPRRATARQLVDPRRRPAVRLRVVHAGDGAVEAWKQEIIFAASMAIVLFLMSRLVRELEPEARNTLSAPRW